MPDSAGTRSAGRQLHPRNWAPSLTQTFLVLPFVVALLGASTVVYGTPWAASATKPQCNNRIDDDGDGKIDYPADRGCTGRGDKSEVDPVEPPPPPPPPPGDEPPPIAGQGYNKVFSDEFETLNRAVWDDHIWYMGSPPAGAQYVDQSVLHLVSSADSGYEPTTVTTQTANKVFEQGYFEARMKWLGGGHGAWPAWWLFSYRTATDPAYPSINPYCTNNGLPRAECLSSELDVMDEGGAVTDLYVGLHRNSCNCFGEGNILRPNPNWFAQGVDLSADWHIYSALWTAGQVKFYLDEDLISTVDTFDSTDQPMFLLLQNWTHNGCWDCGQTNGTDTDTQVDWVRVWQKP
jgi:beta-glucanase (GH16 family)